MGDSMKTFIWKMNMGASASTHHNVTKTQFGDGYAQRASFGINNKRTDWSGTKTGDWASVIKPIKDFLDEHGGIRPFIWTDPYGNTAKYVCQEYEVTQRKGNFWQISLKFEQVFTGYAQQTTRANDMSEANVNYLANPLDVVRQSALQAEVRKLDERIRALEQQLQTFRASTGGPVTRTERQDTQGSQSTNGGIVLNDTVKAHQLTNHQVAMISALIEASNRDLARVNKVLAQTEYGAETGVQRLQSIASFTQSKASNIARAYRTKREARNLTQRARQALGEIS